ncbi:MAG: radical SAM protein [Elusimicrobiota bacterium]
MENKKVWKYIYGPVYSWRLGYSLGIDLLSQSDKMCNFDCVYCQIGTTKEYCVKRQVFVRTEDLINEISSFPESRIDYITFSGRGEPTLALNLREILEKTKKIRKGKIAVITNSTLLDQTDVLETLSKADKVIAKCDASSQDMLKEMNNPAPGISFEKIVSALETLRKKMHGALSLQVMCIESNKNNIYDLIPHIKKIMPQEVDINTPLRPSSVVPLTEDEIRKIYAHFKKELEPLSIRVMSVYDGERKKIQPISENSTLIRRGKEV